jgi:hypothetical protein
MIVVDKNEQFILTASFISDFLLLEGADVSYEIYDDSDIVVSSGTMAESSVQPGIYKANESISEGGYYICYINTEDRSIAEQIEVNNDTDYLLAKQNRNYNISIEEVVLTNVPTGTQVDRNVKQGNTDYVIERVKEDGNDDWIGTTASGNVYVWYQQNSRPFKVGGN